jgi:hypothetical protein
MNEDQLTRALTENFLRDRLQPMPSLSPEQQEALAKLVQGSMSHKTQVDPDARTSRFDDITLHRKLSGTRPIAPYIALPTSDKIQKASIYGQMDQVSDESEQEFIRNNPRYRKDKP